MRWLFCIALFACSTTDLDLDRPVDGKLPPDAGPPVSDGGTSFTIVTWNVENLFDEQNDPFKEDTVATAAEVEAKLAALQAVIAALRPDVLALQEVENKSILDRLCDGLPQLGLVERRLVEGFDPRGIDVALATRFRITHTASHIGEDFFHENGDGPFSYSRDALEVHMNVAGRRVAVLVAHQISRLGDNDIKRQAQALYTRQIADALRAADPQGSVIIAGDMNDTPETPTIGYYIAGGAFVDVTVDVPQAERWTYSSFGQPQYDYIFPDSVLGGHRALVFIPHGDDVRAASDHAPVVSTFQVP